MYCCGLAGIQQYMDAAQELSNKRVSLSLDAVGAGKSRHCQVKSKSGEETTKSQRMTKNVTAASRTNVKNG